MSKRSRKKRRYRRQRDADLAYRRKIARMELISRRKREERKLDQSLKHVETQKEIGHH